MKTLIVANWKMHPRTLREAKALLAVTRAAAAKARGASVVVCPPAVFLSNLAQGSRGKSVVFGAQDCAAEAKGAHTGEVSAGMLFDRGARFVILGHSERRAQGERNEEVNRKVIAAHAAGLTAILCVGERERDPEGMYLGLVKDEVVEALRGVPREALASVIVAYEPIWAIGKRAEDAMRPHDAHETALYIRKVLRETYAHDDALKVPILYGGSVEAENARSILAEGGVDGLLVGHQSIEPKGFADLLRHVGRGSKK
jgi:triosephosphate isomerase (TIM)